MHPVVHKTSLVSIDYLHKFNSNFQNEAILITKYKDKMKIRSCLDKEFEIEDFTWNETYKKL